MTVFEYDGSLRPMAVSYAVAASLLDGTRSKAGSSCPARRWPTSCGTTAG